MSSLVLEHAGDPTSLFKLIGSFLNKPIKNPLPEHTSVQQLAENFNTYFDNKTLHIHNNLKDTKSKFNINETEDIRNYEIKLVCFEQVSEEYVLSIIKSYPKKSCSLDPMSTRLLVKCEPFILPVITRIINSSITRSHVPPTMKSAITNTLLKKLNLALLQKYYGPVSNLKYYQN